MRKALLPTQPALVRALALSALAICLAGFASAGPISVNTIGEYDGPILVNPTYPQPSITIGTFVYTIPSGASIVSATVSGFFGTTLSPSTALEDLFVAGIKVASCVNQADDCWNDPSGVQTPWSYTFTPSQFAALSGGSAVYRVVQNGDFQVESGITTLSITVSPEPASIATFGAGLALVAFLRYRRRA